jgi:hypothetical protein
MLRLLNVNETDSGRYQCSVQDTLNGMVNFDASYLKIAKQTGDQSNAFPIYIRVIDATVETEHKSMATHKFGIKFIAECFVNHDELEQLNNNRIDVTDITWRKVDGLSRATSDLNVNNHNNHSSFNRMTIPAFLSMDLGTYVCYATDKKGQRAQNSIILSRSTENPALFAYDITGLSQPFNLNYTKQHDNANSNTNNDQKFNTSNSHNYNDNDDDDNQQNKQPQVKILGTKQLNLKEGN